MKAPLFMSRFLLIVALVAGCAPSAKEAAVSQPPAAIPGRPTSVPKSSPADSAGAHGHGSTPSRSAAPKKAKPQSLDELLLFYPSKYPDGDWHPKGLSFRDVWFRAKDGTRLHGWCCACDQPRAVLLFAHGNAGNLSHRAGRLQYLQTQLRVTALIFDYRGYGRSEGVPTVEGILQDARAARTQLAQLAAVPESQVVLMGRSLGGAVAVQLAAGSPARGLILESTFSSLKEVAAYHYPKLAWLVPAGKLDSLAQIKRYKGPLLQSHGDADGTIPYALGLKLFRAASGPKEWVTIHGGDHNSPQSTEYYRQLDRFISDLPAR